MTLLQERREWMKEVIDEMVENYLGFKAGEDISPKRKCATCGKKFVPHTRNHFFHRTECRKEFYRGQFVTRRKK